MMLQRTAAIFAIFITAVLSVPLAHAGFIAPILPAHSRAIYRLQSKRPSTETALTAISSVSSAPSAVFYLDVGFKRSALRSFQPGFSHRQKAEELIKRLSSGFQDAGLPDVQIKVAKIYASTGEVILEVEDPDASRVDSDRAAIINALEVMPGMLFAGAPEKVKVE